MAKATHRGSRIRTDAGERPDHSRLTVSGVDLGEYPGTEEHVLAEGKARIDAAQADAEGRARAVPMMLGHLRRGEGVVAKVGRAARALVGTFKSLARRRSVARAYVARHVLLRFLAVEQAERHNQELAEGGTYTAAIYMRDVLQLPAGHIARYAGAFGVKAAQAYREIFGAEPAAFGLTVIGRRRPRLAACATYGEHARLALDRAAHTHRATADAIGA